MKGRASRRRALGALAGAGIPAVLCLFLAGTASAAPILSLEATDAVVGQPIHATAQLSESPDAIGEITFQVFGPDDSTCAGAAIATTAAAVAGAGEYLSGDFTAPAAGTYRWSAHYSGDSQNLPADSTCSAISTVGKAAPTLRSGEATSAATVGLPITDSVELAGSFGASGQIVFRAYGPGDPTCAAPARYEAAVAVSGDGSYSPPGFVPPPGLYQWIAEYGGDSNNNSFSLPCGSASQASAVGAVAVTLAAGAGGGPVGSPVSATATIQNGAIPGGQITFRAFPPADANCTAAPAFSSTVAVAGNGSYRSAPFVPARVGSFRWTVAYSGDVNHAAAAAGCGAAVSSISQAKPSIAGEVTRRLTVGARFRDTATLTGAYAPTGTITFRIYGPIAAGCSQPAFINTVAVSGNGTISSDPFVAKRPGRYSFVASYSGDTRNQATTEPCDSPAQVARVRKRTPKVEPRAVLLGRKRISIRAHLRGGTTPTGVINFRLFRPGDTLCKGKPAFRGGRTVESNGTFSLAEYLATKPGVYRLEVGYSGDPRNTPYESACGAQSIRIGKPR